MAACAPTSYREADEEFGEGSSLSELGRWTERRTGVTIGALAQALDGDRI